MKKTLIILTMTFLASCATEKKEQAEEKSKSVVVENQKSIPMLKKLWESDTTLTTAESVLHDPINEVLYVSCINGVPPSAKDGDGFIAKVSVSDGSIIELKWIEGLSAPKGMALMDEMLYVTDIDQVVIIDVITGEISEKIPVKGAKFLNDITLDDLGNAFVSDSDTDKIHMINKKGKVKTWIEGLSIGRPNGLYYDGSDILMSTSAAGTFNSINYETKEITVLTDSIFGGDGVEKTGDDFLVSSWNGELYYVTSGWKKTKILDTKAQKINAADIEFIATQNLVLVPTFFDNRVVAYKLVK